MRKFSDSENTMSKIYDTIGNTYASTRAADPRIVDKLVQLLNLPEESRILDVGAGTGNYSSALAKRGFEVTALEPSSVMRQQGKQYTRLRWLEGVSEQLPFDDASFDGVVMTLCIHHFTNWERAFAEASRVVSAGPIVILTVDAEFDSEFWLYDYFPGFLARDRQWFPRVTDMRHYSELQLSKVFEVFKFPLPRDLKDAFLASAWPRPHLYLDPVFQAGISSFSVTEQSEIVDGLRDLENDLACGAWEKRYGAVRSADTFDAGYRFIRMIAQA